MKQLIVLLILWMGLLNVSTLASAQSVDSLNLDSLSKTEREKVLLRLTKNVVLRRAPEYYREYKTPVIKNKRPETSNDLFTSICEKNKGRSYYTVEYPYDLNEEVFQSGYSIKVYFWGNNCKIFLIVTGHGRYVEDYYALSDKEKEKLVFPYTKVRPKRMVHDTIRDADGKVIEIRHRYVRDDK